jgi:hypothetical protein
MARARHEKRRAAVTTITTWWRRVAQAQAMQLASQVVARQEKVRAAVEARQEKARAAVTRITTWWRVVSKAAAVCSCPCEVPAECPDWIRRMVSTSQGEDLQTATTYHRCKCTGCGSPMPGEDHRCQCQVASALMAAQRGLCLFCGGDEEALPMKKRRHTMNRRGGGDEEALPHVVRKAAAPSAGSSGAASSGATHNSETEALLDNDYEYDSEIEALLARHAANKRSKRGDTHAQAGEGRQE